MCGFAFLCAVIIAGTLEQSGEVRGSRDIAAFLGNASATIIYLILSPNSSAGFAQAMALFHALERGARRRRQLLLSGELLAVRQSIALAFPLRSAASALP
jgi:hypothetical protein